MKVVRLWLYRVEEGVRHPDYKASDTNQYVVREVRGDFEYWDIENGVARQVNRRIADSWAAKTGKKVETQRGYPTFMFDLGFRV